MNEGNPINFDEIQGPLSKKAMYDLFKMAKSLPKEHSKLARGIRRYLQSQSWRTDIKLARDFVEDAIRLDKTGRRSVFHAKNALIQAAVMGYARVFDKASKHRGAFPIGEELAAEQKKLHEKILGLRHEALAHFGPEGVEIPWNQDHCLIIREGHTFQVAGLSRRSSFEADFAKEFYSHLVKIDKITHSHVVKLRQSLENEIDLTWLEVRDFDSILVAFEVNPETFGGWDGPILSHRRSFDDENTTIVL